MSDKCLGFGFLEFKNAINRTMKPNVLVKKRICNTRENEIFLIAYQDNVYQTRRMFSKVSWLRDRLVK